MKRTSDFDNFTVVLQKSNEIDMNGSYRGKERALNEKDRQQEILEKERELMLLKKSRAELLLQDKERSGYRKYLPYVIVLLGICGIGFIRNWMAFYFDPLPRYDLFIILFIFFLLLDFMRGRRRKRIHKKSRVYTQQIQRLQEEILQMKQMNT